jgi:hypothetical protein
MRIAYLTTDEVNLHLAEGMAAACGLTLYPLWPRESPPDGGFDAVLYDWDCLPQPERQKLLAELLAGPRPRAVALHGYNLEDGQAEALRRHSVAVYRRSTERGRWGGRCPALLGPVATASRGCPSSSSKRRSAVPAAPTSFRRPVPPRVFLIGSRLPRKRRARRRGPPRCSPPGTPASTATR